MGVVSKVLQTLGAHVLVFAQGLVLIPIVIKTAGTEVYGELVLAVTYLGLLFSVSSIGVGFMAKRNLPAADSTEQRSGLFLPQFHFQMASAMLLAMLTMAAYSYATSSGLRPFAGASVWLIPAYVGFYVLYSQSADYFRYTHRFGKFNAMTLVQPYLFIGISLAQYYFLGRMDTGSLLLSMVISCAVVGIAGAAAIRREIGFGPRFPSATAIRADVALGMPLVLSSVLDALLAGGDRYLIALFMSARDVGIYAPAYALGSLILVLPKVFGVVVLPLLSQRVDAGDSDGAARLMASTTRIFIMVAVPYVAGAAVLADSVLELVANREVAQSAWLVTPIVAIGSIAYGMVLINTNLMFVRLKTSTLLLVNAVGVVLNIALNVALLAAFRDVVAAAVATLVSYTAAAVIFSRTVSADEISRPIQMGWVGRVVVASTLMAFALVPMKVASAGFGPWGLAACIAVGISLYVALLLLLRIPSEELAFVRRAMGTQDSSLPGT